MKGVIHLLCFEDCHQSEAQVAITFTLSQLASEQVSSHLSSPNQPFSLINKT